MVIQDVLVAPAGCNALQRKQLAEQVRVGNAVGPDEYPAPLKAVYEQSDLSGPRDLVGLVKDQPCGEMEKLPLAGIPAGGEALRQLPVKRELAVKNDLVSRDLPPDRVFLDAVKAAPPDGKWSPHAELNLAKP